MIRVRKFPNEWRGKATFRVEKCSHCAAACGSIRDNKAALSYIFIRVSRSVKFSLTRHRVPVVHRSAKSAFRGRRGRSLREAECLSVDATRIPFISTTLLSPARLVRVWRSWWALVSTGWAFATTWHWGMHSRGLKLALYLWFWKKARRMRESI